MSSTGWGKRRSFRPDPGVEVDSDDTLFDVVAWRKNGRQERNGQTHERGYDPQLASILGLVLKELRKINQQLTLMTDEEF